MENGDIPDGNIQASSEHSSNFQARYGRLNGPRYWTTSIPLSWIQADLGYQTFVAGLITQGNNGNEYVTSFKVSTFSMTTFDDEIYVSDQDGVEKVNMINLIIDVPLNRPFP